MKDVKHQSIAMGNPQTPSRVQTRNNTATNVEESALNLLLPLFERTSTARIIVRNASQLCYNGAVRLALDLVQVRVVWYGAVDREQQIRHANCTRWTP